MNCPKCNAEMWDNRNKKKNPKAPDYKCKDTNCDGVIWPPKQQQAQSSPQQYAPQPLPATHTAVPNISEIVTLLQETNVLLAEISTKLGGQMAHAKSELQPDNKIQF